MLIESLQKNLLTKRLIYGILYTVDEGRARGCAARPPLTYERGLFAMSIFVVTSEFSYFNIILGATNVVSVSAAFFSVEKADAWGDDWQARREEALAKVVKDWGEGSYEGSLEWDGYLRIETPLY